MSIQLEPIGRVESELKDLASAPRQADEGAPEAWLVFGRVRFVEFDQGVRPLEFEISTYPRSQNSSALTP